MGEEVKMRDLDGGNEEDRVREWETGLPSADELTPLSHSLVSPGLAGAFSISPEPHRSILDVNRASRNTVSSLCRHSLSSSSSNNFNSLKSFNSDDKNANSLIIEGEDDDDDDEEEEEENREGKLRRIDCAEEADSALRTENSKRPRLVWTPQLHKRFVDVVAYLGIKNAVPKTIMQLMNVEGLTRENVASHLQKYRLYLKRTPGSGDQLGGGNQNGNGNVPQVPYGTPVGSMPVFGTAHGPGHMGMHPYHGFESNPYS